RARRAGRRSGTGPHRTLAEDSVGLDGPGPGISQRWFLRTVPGQRPNRTGRPHPPRVGTRGGNPGAQRFAPAAMSDPVRIALVGEYNPAVKAHRAILLAVDLAAAGLPRKVEVVWTATPSLD